MKTEDELDAEIAQMFDEVKEVRVETVDGKPRVIGDCWLWRRVHE